MSMEGGSLKSINTGREFYKNRYEELATRKLGAAALDKFPVEQQKQLIEEEVKWVAYEDAVKENIDFDKRKSIEYRRWDHNLQTVINRLEKKRDLPSGETKHIRPLLLVLGGGMKAPLAGGQVAALKEAGLLDSFEEFGGASAGSGLSSMSGAGLMRNALALYANKCTTKEFLDLGRIKKSLINSVASKFGWGSDEPIAPALDTSVIAREMRSGPMRLDEDAVRNSKKGIYVLATNWETHKAELINVKTATHNGKLDVVSPHEASSAIRFFRKPEEVNGKLYYDGQFGMDAETLAMILDSIDPPVTDILILTNQSFDSFESDAFQYTKSERAALTGTMGTTKAADAMGVNFTDSSLGAVEQYFKLKENVRGFLEQVQKERNVNIGVKWAPLTDADTINNDRLSITNSMVSGYSEMLARLKYKGDIPKELDISPEEATADSERAESLEKAA